MKTKTCSRCKIEKTTDQYFKAAQQKDGFQFQCKDCAKLYHRRPEVIKQYVARTQKLVQRNRKAFIEYKKKQTCEFCPENTYECLEFHHIDPSEKDFNVSEFGSISLQRMWDEIAKCVCVCANCHRKIHAGYIKI